VLLFHDQTTFGVGIAEMLDHGLGLLPGLVFLPHARERLDLGATRNVAILARRLAPARAIGLQNGAVLERGVSPRVEGRADTAFELGIDGVLHPLRGA
jgi:hypothetical protein